MPRQVHKQQVIIGQPFKLPGKAVHFDVQGGQETVWYENDSTSDHETTYCIYGTGWDIPAEALHVATLLRNNFVWHLYRQ